MLEVVLAARDREEHDRADDEHQAHEYLEGYDVHVWLLGESAATVTAMVVTELTGMKTAQSSGDITPASARPIAIAL